MLNDNPSVRARLEDELIGWLTTVAEDGQPQASAVWHLTDGDDLIVYSGADATRLTNLESNPKVAFNLRGDRQGDTVVTLEGTAAIDPAVPSPNADPAYIDKYGDEMVRLGWSHDQFAEEYPIALRVTVTRVRAT